MRYRRFGVRGYNPQGWRYKICRGRSSSSIDQINFSKLEWLDGTAAAERARGVECGECRVLTKVGPLIETHPRGWDRRSPGRQGKFPFEPGREIGSRIGHLLDMAAEMPVFPTPAITLLE